MFFGILACAYSRPARTAERRRVALPRACGSVRRVHARCRCAHAPLKLLYHVNALVDVPELLATLSELRQFSETTELADGAGAR